MDSSNIQRHLLSDISHSMKKTELQHKKVISQRTKARNNSYHHKRHSRENNLTLQDHQKEWKREAIGVLPAVSEQHVQYEKEYMSGGTLDFLSPIVAGNDKKSDVEFNQVMNDKFNEESVVPHRMPYYFINEKWDSLDGWKAGDEKKTDVMKQSRRRIKNRLVTKLPKLNGERCLTGGNAMESSNLNPSSVQKLRSRSQPNIHSEATCHQNYHQHPHHRKLYSKNCKLTTSKPVINSITTTHALPKKVEATLPAIASAGSPSAADTPTAANDDDDNGKNNDIDDDGLKDNKKGIDEKTKKLLKRAKRMSSEYKEVQVKYLAEIYGEEKETIQSPTPATPSGSKSISQAVFSSQPSSASVRSSVDVGVSSAVTPPRGSILPAITPNSNSSRTNRKKQHRINRHITRQLSRQVSQDASSPLPGYVRLDATTIAPVYSEESYDVFDQEPVAAKTRPLRQKQLNTGISFGNDFDDQGISCGSVLKTSHMKISIKEPKKHFALMAGDIW
jgi:hypothetical protein